MRKINLTHANQQSWIDTLWDALHVYRENCIPEGPRSFDAEWDELCTAMAWLTEELGLTSAVEGSSPSAPATDA